MEPVAVGVDEHVEDQVEEEEGRHEGVVERVLAQEVGELGVACMAGRGGVSVDDGRDNQVRLSIPPQVRMHARCARAPMVKKAAAGSTP